MAPGSRSKRRGKGAQAPGVSSPPAQPAPPEPRKLLSYRDIDELPDPVERRRAMLDLMFANREQAQSRSYTNKRGDTVVAPDHGAIERIDEAVLEVLGVYASPPSALRRPVDLSVFNGGKAAATKAS